MFFTYIIYSKSRDLFYKGSTNNVDKRLKRHNSGYETFTSKGIPWVLIWFTSKESKAEAYQLELKLKNLSRARLIRFILKNEGGITNFELVLKLSNKFKL